MPFYPGWFLVAKPILRDPNFHQTVVLLVQHSEEGGFGLVVNRPIPVKELPYPVYSGGPCEAQGMFIVHGHPEWVLDEEEDGDGDSLTQIAEGIYLGDASCANLIKELDTEETKLIRMFAGYSGWGPGQLEQELAEGAWALTPANGELLFETPPEDLWSHLKPPAIPEPSTN